MTKAEIVSTYLVPVIVAALTALAGFLGTQLKKLYEKYINDKTKEAVVRTCVKAAEQLYHDLSGPEKLAKAQEGVVQMLNEKGIPISELEMNLLIESVVSEFNYGFGTAVGQTTPQSPLGDSSPDKGSQGAGNAAFPADEITVRSLDCARDDRAEAKTAEAAYTEEGGSQ